MNLAEAQLGEDSRKSLMAMEARTSTESLSATGRVVKGSIWIKSSSIAVRSEAAVEECWRYFGDTGKDSEGVRQELQPWLRSVGDIDWVSRGKAFALMPPILVCRQPTGVEYERDKLAS